MTQLSVVWGWVGVVSLDCLLDRWKMILGLIGVITRWYAYLESIPCLLFRPETAWTHIHMHTRTLHTRDCKVCSIGDWYCPCIQSSVAISFMQPLTFEKQYPVSFPFSSEQIAGRWEIKRVWLPWSCPSLLHVASRVLVSIFLQVGLPLLQGGSNQPMSDHSHKKRGAKFPLGACEKLTTGGRAPPHANGSNFTKEVLVKQRTRNYHSLLKWEVRVSFKEL